MVNNWLHRLFPGRCVLCGDPAPVQDLCAPCSRELPRVGTACPCCGLPLAYSGAPCGACLRHPPRFRRCLSPFLYQPPVSQLITAFKYRGTLSHGRVLSLQLAEYLRERHSDPVDALLPVPLHWRRRWRRGFNQAEVIAAELGRAMDLPMRRLLQRRRATPPQQTLGAAERARNLRGAFAPTQPVAGLRLALIDDVVTTGATADELARTLLEAGAAVVDVWCLARTPL